MTNPNLSELIVTTLRERENRIVDNFTNKNFLLKRLKAKGKVKKLDGGRTIVKPLFYAENGTFKRYSGYEALNTSASDVITAAEFSWKQSAVTVSIDGLTLRQNMGSNRIFDLLEERINNALLTFDNNVASDIYSDGTADGGKQIGGLQLLVADDPTTGTVGGINRANYTFWRNYSFDATSDGGAAASSTTIQGYMNRVWLQVMRGSNEKPDLIVADNNYWLAYLESLQAIQRIQTIGGADGGGELTLKFFSADVIPDGGSGIPTNHMYFLNTDYISFEVHKDAFMTPKDQRESTNQDALIVPIIFQGNMTLNNAARQGLLKD